jgi:hypothetical protein
MLTVSIKILNTILTTNSARFGTALAFLTWANIYRTDCVLTHAVLPAEHRRISIRLRPHGFRLNRRLTLRVITAVLVMGSAINNRQLPAFATGWI